LRKRDVLWEALAGLRHRRLRAALCALGIALGIAAVVAVVAIPASSQAALLDRLGRDGNLLTVASGQTIDNTPAPLPLAAAGMLRRIAGVEQVAPVGYVAGATIRRTDAIPPANTNGIAVMTADTSLVAALNLTVVSGRFLDPATDRYPAVVLGAGAARALGIAHATPDTQVYLGSSDVPGGQYATVLGVLAPVPLAPELDTAALFGNPAAGTLLGFDGAPNRVYLRAEPDQVPAVRGLLAPTTNPADRHGAGVGRGGGGRDRAAGRGRRGGQRDGGVGAGASQ
jgi:putative ABC transport system permease protein